VSCTSGKINAFAFLITIEGDDAGDVQKSLVGVVESRMGALSLRTGVFWDGNFLLAELQLDQCSSFCLPSCS